MPFRLMGGDIECDTAEEARAFLIPAKKTFKKNPKVKKRWAAVRALAKKEKITFQEARAKLKKK